MFLPDETLKTKLLKMLAEDLGQGDVTTEAIVQAEIRGDAYITAKKAGTIAGIHEACILLSTLGLEVHALINDGQKCRKNQRLLSVSGDARTILCAERTILNLMSRMSGIATATAEITEKLNKAKLTARVAATRKTAPGLGYFDKRAIMLGGGDTHRLHLDDAVLIKDNHIIVASSLENAIKKAKQHVSFTKKIEVEVSRPEEASKAAQVGADIVMLDNFEPDEVAETVRLLKKMNLYGKVLLEASGGITSSNVLQYASKGVDIVSMGELTSSVRALDMNLKMVRISQASLMQV